MWYIARIPPSESHWNPAYHELLASVDPTTKAARWTLDRREAQKYRDKGWAEYQVTSLPVILQKVVKVIELPVVR